MRRLSELFQRSPRHLKEAKKNQLYHDAACEEKTEDEDQQTSSISVGIAQTSSRTRLGQDRVIYCKLQEGLIVVGVVDGHGSKKDGHLCAEYLSQALPRTISQCLLEGQNKARALKHSFKICSDEWDNTCHLPDRASAGAVALVALIDERNNEFFIANAGDCQAACSQSDGNLKIINTLHRANNESEKERVISKGGTVIKVDGIPRVQGNLIPTRVFGDCRIRTNEDGELLHFVDPDPDIFQVYPESPVIEDIPRGRYIILGTDGFWDDLKSEKISQVVNSSLNNDNAQQVSNNLLSIASKVSKDDISVCVIHWN